MAASNSYEKISNKIKSMKDLYTSLRGKSDSYVFSALCIKASLYKNPAYVLDESDFEEMIVDGKNDGGVDILLTDPSSDSSDLVIAQSKYYTRITNDDVRDALGKMATFYKDMCQGRYDQINENIQRRFLSLSAELGDESKIHFILYTSAPQSHIRKDSIEKKLMELFTNQSKVEVSILFGKDIEDEIDESESRRPSVEQGKILIDSVDNYLSYGDDAIIVNASAFSIKALYAQYNIQLLAKNLRYHIRGEIDRRIEKTIADDPEWFWFMNNGITIVCEDFRVDGCEVKLRYFSIINGGQTTYVIHKSRNIDANHDLFLPCKIIKIEGDTEDERNKFSLAIAIATNTQKPIKDVDRKANEPEQMRFSQAMRDVGIYYQTKRGEKVPKSFREPYLNTSLVEIGKLCIAAVFQMPCTSRNKPSALYKSPYYEKIFDGNQQQIAQISKELLYIDYFFRNMFIKQFDRDNDKKPGREDYITFAHNARTICIAFTALAARYFQGNVQDQELDIIFSAARQDSSSGWERMYEMLSDLGSISYLLPTSVFNQKAKYEGILTKLFTIIINAGANSFSIAKRYDTTLTATNYLKSDRNYYLILSDHWATSIEHGIREVFNEMS